MRRLFLLPALLLVLPSVAPGGVKRARLRKPRHGFQIRSAPFTVAPHSEREVCQLVTLGNRRPIDVQELRVAMPRARRYTSHHFAIFIYTGPKRANLAKGAFDAVGCVGTGTGFVSPILAFVQRPREQLAFPEGLGVTLEPHQRLLLNTHYINDGPRPVTVGVKINFHAAPPGTIRHHLRSFQLGTVRIAVPPREAASATATWTTPFPMNVVWLTSHSHKHTETVDVELMRGGAPAGLALRTDDYADPTVVRYEPPFLRLEAGDGLRWTCNYYNPGLGPLRFGVTSNDEMCFALGFFYPDDDTAALPPARNCFGNGNGLVCPFN